MSIFESPKVRLVVIVVLEVAIAVLAIGAVVDRSWWLLAAALAAGAVFGVIYLTDRGGSAEPAPENRGRPPTDDEVDKVVFAEDNEMTAIRALRAVSPGLRLDTAKRLVQQSRDRQQNT